MKRAKILVVDDDADFLAMIRSYIERPQKYIMLPASGAREAAGIIDEHPDIRCILLDYYMPEIDGGEFSVQLRQHLPHIPVIQITGREGLQEKHVQEQARREYTRFCRKSASDIMQALEDTVNTDSEEDVDPALLKQARAIGLIIESRAMRKVFTEVLGAATGGHNVLLLGPSGCGKTPIAHAIHHFGPNADEVFTIQNCGLANSAPDIFMATLFGKVKGAYSGALENSRGLLTAAGKGTMFFDEIAELPLGLQAAILNLVDPKQKTYRRLGEEKEQQVDCRFVFATNRDVRAAVKAGEFRHDLEWRLAEQRIIIPGLDERKEDIPALVRYFLQKAEQERGCLYRIAPDALDHLLRQPWPGNVRQLQSFVGQLVNHADSDNIRFRDVQRILDKQGSHHRDTAGLNRAIGVVAKHRDTSSPEPATSAHLPAEALPEDRLYALIPKLFQNHATPHLLDIQERIDKEMLTASLQWSLNLSDAGRRFWGQTRGNRSFLRNRITKHGVRPEDYLGRKLNRNPGSEEL